MGERYLGEASDAPPTPPGRGLTSGGSATGRLPLPPPPTTALVVGARGGDEGLSGEGVRVAPPPAVAPVRPLVRLELLLFVSLAKRGDAGISPRGEAGGCGVRRGDDANDGEVRDARTLPPPPPVLALGDAGAAASCCCCCC